MKNYTLNNVQQLIWLAERVVTTYHLVDNNNKLQERSGGVADAGKVQFAKELKYWIDQYGLEEIIGQEV